jgi:hypothetical protein
MRYNPRTDQALSIEEISEQCWQAVRTNQQPRHRPPEFGIAPVARSIADRLTEDDQL